METDDHALLRAYARDGSHAAFAVLVQRYVNLVFSAARRQVRSHDLAQEATQLVFILLARKAGGLSPRTPLAAWLYLVTRRTARDVLRGEARRAAREKIAVELAAMKTNAPDWSTIEPLLDDAMGRLSEADGSAVVLRFFENKSLREVGTALGISEDAAQKRVSRALEQLRAAFGRRGIAVTAAGLASHLSAHAVELAPAGLGVAVSAAVTVSAAAATGGGLATLFTTPLQKNALVATLALGAGAALFEGAVMFRQRTEIARAVRQERAEEAELARLRAAKDASIERLATIEREIDERLAAMRPPAPDPVDTALLAQMEVWLGRVHKLDGFLAARPDLDTPELQLVPRETWLGFASVHDNATEEDLRRAAARIRNMAGSRANEAMGRALDAYVKANDGWLPVTAAELAPFVSPRITPAMLARFDLWQTGRYDAVPPERRGRVVSLRPADVEFDTAYWTGPAASYSISAIKFSHTFAQEGFARVHDGRVATRAEELMPYLKWPVSVAALQKAINQAGKAP